MFARLPDLAPGDPVPITIDGVAFTARKGDSVAAALLAAGLRACRTTAVSGAPRAPFCMMGACFECLVTIDGGMNQQSCLVTVAPDMRVTTQHGALVAISAEGPPQGANSTPSGGSEAAPAASVGVADVAVVGAGPAGLTAATVCAESGLSVVLFDEQSSPGGQVYRGITASVLARRDILGDDYRRGAALIAPFERSGARYVPNAAVWSIAAHADGGFEVAVSTGPGAARESRLVRARTIVLATGALERPFPVRGWTLPGVMMAGAAQVLLKTSGLVPDGRTVLAGNGPLLWLVAWQYLRAGVKLAAVLDTTPRGRLAQVLRHAPAFMMSPYFGKGRELVRAVRRGVRVVEYVDSLSLEGDDALSAVRFRSGGDAQTLPAEHALLHQGVVPDVNLASAAGCAIAWDDLGACFAPVVDAWGGTSVPGVYAAGDAAGVAGAEAGEARGRLTALAVANAHGRIDGGTRDRAAQSSLRALVRALRGRRFLDVLYRPADAFRTPDGDTLACRCEEVPAATIARLARDGCAGPNQMKAYTRCGMGPCQGRYCGLTVTEIIARETRRSCAEVGSLHARFPVKPVTLREIASLPASMESHSAVDRELQ